MKKNHNQPSVRKALTAVVAVGALGLAGCAVDRTARFETDHPSTTVPNEQIAQIDAAAKKKVLDIFENMDSKSLGGTVYVQKSTNDISNSETFGTIFINKTEDGAVEMAYSEDTAYSRTTSGETKADGSTAVTTTEHPDFMTINKITLTNPDGVAYDLTQFSGQAGEVKVDQFLRDPNTHVRTLVTDGVADLHDTITTTVSGNSITLDTSDVQGGSWGGDLEALSHKVGTSAEQNAFVELAINQINDNVHFGY